MELNVIDTQGKTVGSLQVSDALFGRAYNETLVHQVVTAFLSNARSANRAQLTRAEVKHSTKKPFRQKGTGNARVGMTSTPNRRGGGRAFPSKPDENFYQKVNRKMFRAGMATILSQLVREERLVVLDELNVTSPKTKEFFRTVQSMGLDQALFVTRGVSENLYLSSRNLSDVLVVEAAQTDPYSLLRFKKTVVTRDAVKQLEEQWG